ncbi:MAG: aminotransferase DegT [Candidatus Hydrothermarchaeota archaeon]|nr:MAG: aminotransferase DegT [Candidatus Hydrothermarchaeota archaeon]
MIPIAKPLIGEEEKRAVLEVLSSGMLAQGKKVAKFEENFADYIKVKHAIAVNSGTSALHAALLACGIRRGDEVITTPFSFIATANAILYCQAKPVFADIDEKTFNIDPEQIKEKITSKTKALLVVHLYGLPCEMQAIKEICEDYKLLLIEDACQAHGAEYKGKRVGSFGDAGVFSFYPTKNMTTGEGGMITTNNEKIAEKARLIREHGAKQRYLHETLGYNYRMTDIAAAIGIEQLKKLDKMNGTRIKNAEILTKGIRGINGITLPFVPLGTKHVFHQYTIRITEDYKLTREQLIEKMKANGIATMIYYPIPIHKQPLYIKLGYKDKLPNAEKACEEVLSLPVHAGVDRDGINRIIEVIKGEGE